MLNDVTPEFEDHLRGLLSSAAIKSDTDRYFEENRGRWTGTGFVVAPADTQEVVLVVKACAEHNVPIIPYGGGTGLVGGQLKESGPRPVVLSLERMTQIRAVHAEEGVIIVDAGVILADIQTAAQEVGQLFPLSLASEGSARIGGLLATNAGGINTLRYGNARAHCLGVEVVRPDGSIWNGLSRLRKDNTGYDLKDLMIGSEGTLGIITAASLQMSPQPTSEGAAFLTVPSAEAALSLLALFRKQVGNAVSAFEIIHKQGLDFLSETMSEVRQPFEESPEWSVLVDLGLSGGLVANEVLEDVFAKAFDDGLVTDGIIAQSEADRAAFWRVRETIPEANRRIGSVSSHDISLPLGQIPQFLIEAGAAVEELGTFRINCFGHLGDGNLHYNVFPAPGKSRQDHLPERDEIKRVLHDLTHALGGSVSAEHGIGRLKVDDLEKYADPAKLDMLRAIKAALDPKGIMNPGAVLKQP